MAPLIDRFTVATLSRQISDIVAAYLVILIAYGGQIQGPADVVALAQVILAIKLHIFALPLAWTPVFGRVPLWGWYIVAVLWLWRFIINSGYTTSEVVAQLEAAWDRRRHGGVRQHAKPDAVADGGVKSPDEKQETDQ